MSCWLSKNQQLRFLQSLQFDGSDATRSHQKVVKKMSKSQKVINFVGWPRLSVGQGPRIKFTLEGFLFVSI